MTRIDDWTTIKVDTTIYETVSGESVPVKVLTRPGEFRSISDERRIWTFAGKAGGKVRTFHKAQGYDHYGPRLTFEPECPVKEE